MKLVRNLAAALILACALTVNVYAGDLQTPGFVPPPIPTSSPMTDKADTSSDTDGKATTSENKAIEPEDLLISAVLALLSVF